MAVEFFGQWNRKEGRFMPLTVADAELRDALVDGRDYRITSTQQTGRSVRQNNLRWKVCEIVAENTDDGLTKEQVDHVLRMETGLWTPIAAGQGRYYRVAKETNFAAMDHDTFTAWLDKAFEAIGAVFGEGLSDAARSEIEAMTHLRVAA